MHVSNLARMRTLTFPIIGLLVAAGSLHAVTVQSPPDDRASIQNAIDNSKPGDTILFTRGLHEPDGKLLLRQDGPTPVKPARRFSASIRSSISA